MYSRNSVTVPVAPHLVPAISADLSRAFPRVAIDLFVDPEVSLECAPIVLRNRLFGMLRAQGFEPADFPVGIAQDLPVLSLLVTAETVRAVLTYPVETPNGLQRSCVWRTQRSCNLKSPRPPRSVKVRAVEICNDFVTAYRRAAGR